jgi:hypothetical protein
MVLCVDVEPDARTFGHGERPVWSGFERFAARAPELRAHLGEATGSPVAFSWFLRMDPQIAETFGSPTWAAEAYENVLAGLVRDGDEIGLHTHPWRWEGGQWIAEYADQAWADHCVEMGLDAFARAFGRPCRSHRSGDRFLTGGMLSRLEAGGVTVDLTVEPGLPPSGPPRGEPSHGRCPDYRRVPTGPYRSSPARFPAADPARRDGLLLIPMLSAPGRRLRRTTLYANVSPARFVPRLVAALLRDRPSTLPVPVRSDVALEPSWDTLAPNLATMARLGRGRFVTASQAREQLAAAA